MVLFWYPGGTCFAPKTYCEALKLFEMETILSIRARAIPEQLPAVSAKVGTEKCLTSNLPYIHVVIHFNYNDVGNYGYIYFGLSWPQRKQSLDNISMTLLSTMPFNIFLHHNRMICMYSRVLLHIPIMLDFFPAISTKSSNTP